MVHIHIIETLIFFLKIPAINYDRTDFTNDLYDLFNVAQ